MKIVGMLRVKNEARWIAEVLQAIQPACEEIVVFDDHSDDGTPDICASLGATVLSSGFEGLDEARDKNFLLDRARQRGAQWLLAIDGDELLEASGVPNIREAVNDSDAYYCFRVRYLWNSRQSVRVDGVYREFYRPSLFRFQDGCKFVGACAPNFHCGNVPAGLSGKKGKLLDVSLLHLGYMDPADRLRKYAWYNAKDTSPDLDREDHYRHIVQGDIPEVPADAKLKWAGPLQLETL